MNPLMRQLPSRLALALVVTTSFAPAAVAQEGPPPDPGAAAEAPTDPAEVEAEAAEPAEPAAPVEPAAEPAAPPTAPAEPRSVLEVEQPTDEEPAEEEPPTRRRRRSSWQPRAGDYARTAPEPEPPAPYVERGWHVRGRALLSSWLNLDASLQPLKSDSFVMLAGVAVEGEWLPITNTSFTVDLGYTGGGFSSKVFNAVESRTQLHVVSLGAGAGYRIADFLLPYVRAGGSVTFLEAAFHGDNDVYGGWALFTPGVYGMVGLELTLPRERVPLQIFTAGLFTELGYQHVGSFEFAPHESEGELVERRLFDPGTLHLGGPAMRAGITLSF